MINKPIFRIWDKKYKKWAGLPEEVGGRTFNQYYREKLFKTSGLMWMDLDGFSIDDFGGIFLNDECGGSMGLPGDRFQVCFEKKVFESLKDSEPNGNYKII